MTRIHSTQLVAVGLTAFWIAVVLAFSAKADEVVSNAALDEEMGVGHTYIAQVAYCTTRKAIDEVAAVVVAEGKASSTETLMAHSDCTFNLIVFHATDVLATMDVKGDPDVLGYLCALLIEGERDEHGEPVYFPQDDWRPVFAIAFRFKVGEAT